MAWWALIPAAISAVSSIQQKNQATQQNAEATAWNRYNVQTQFSTDINNINSQRAITDLNIAMILAGAEQSSNSTNALTKHKVGQVYQAALYDDLLYEQELGLVWESAELDLQLISMQRAKERGRLEAAQSVSGTVMGQDSNADAVIDQMAQEAMDKFVVKHNADIKAKQINNARATSLYNAQMMISDIEFQGGMSANLERSNAYMQALGMSTQSAISTNASMTTAQSSYESGMAGASLQGSQNSQAINNNFASGMFSSIGQGVSAYYNTKSEGSSLLTNS
jgi:hypothetical protein